MAAEEERVLKASQAESEEGIGPEGNCHRGNCPSSVWMIHFVSFYNVFLSTGDDCSDGQEEWSKEEAFTFVGDGGLKGSSILGETKNHGHCYSSKQHEVEDVENGADGNESGEGMGLDSDKRTETTRGHRQRVVRPCVVSDSFSESKIWLIRVLPAGDLSVLVPS